MSSLPIKASFGEDTRRFTLDELTLANLQRTVAAIFLFEPGQPFVLRHTDAQGAVHAITHTDQLKLLAAGLPSSRPFKVTVDLNVGASAADEAPPAAPATPSNFVPIDSKGAQAAGRARVSDVEYLKNEFHYHRLIVQTAVQEAFRSFGKSVSRVFESEPVDQFVDQSQRRMQLVKEAIRATLLEMREQLREMPSSSEIADRVANALRELRVYSAAALESLRIHIEAAIQRLLASPVQRITDRPVEEVVEMVAVAAEQQGTDASTSQPELPPRDASSSSEVAQPAQAPQEPAVAEPAPVQEQPQEAAQEPQAADELASLRYSAHPHLPAHVVDSAVVAVSSGVLVDSDAASTSTLEPEAQREVDAQPEQPVATSQPAADKPVHVVAETATSTSAADDELIDDDDFVYVDSPSTDNVNSSTYRLPVVASPIPPVTGPFAEQHSALVSMGFTDIDRNTALLTQHEGDVDAVVEALLSCDSP